LAGFELGAKGYRLFLLLLKGKLFEACSAYRGLEGSNGNFT
jgi:hypothetical protein